MEWVAKMGKVGCVNRPEDLQRSATMCQYLRAVIALLRTLPCIHRNHIQVPDKDIRQTEHHQDFCTRRRLESVPV